MSLWFMVDITIVTGVYKPTNITGGPSLSRPGRSWSSWSARASGGSDVRGEPENPSGSPWRFLGCSPALICHSLWPVPHISHGRFLVLDKKKKWDHWDNKIHGFPNTEALNTIKKIPAESEDVHRSVRTCNIVSTFVGGTPTWPIRYDSIFNPQSHVLVHFWKCFEAPQPEPYWALGRPDKSP